MPQTRYVIIGSSHAGLSAVEAIRLTDRDNPVFLLTQEDTLPYSPTILPYVVSGEADPEKIFLKDEDALKGSGVVYRRGEKVVGLDLHARSIILKSGEILDYDKLLLATGAAPVLPPVEGLEGVSCHVLRTLEDALGLRRAMEGSRSAVVLGGGLIGMHAAENLHKGGLKVTLVEALDQILPGYFDREAAGLIRDIFRENGIEVLTGSVPREVYRFPGFWGGAYGRSAVGGNRGPAEDRLFDRIGDRRGRGRTGGRADAHYPSRCLGGGRCGTGTGFFRFREKEDPRHPCKCRRAGTHRGNGYGR
ncbi:MAG: NAD(P)/FAD-dependent oxidoreductase [Deltaproteobacteria bacterium]|nr:NAD(P)/FAD-dependent oxidoreductase [Deltaproteobacteria bacterium]